MFNWKATIILPVLLLAGTLNAAAQEPEIEGLPGVSSQQPLNAPKNRNCTSELVEEKFGDLPTRVYTCTEGAISVYSSTPPVWQRHNPDPYIHGEKDLAHPERRFFTP